MKTDAAHELLSKLATDDAFRSRFEQDPFGTMATLRIEVDPAVRARTDASAIKVPSKEVIAENLDTMASELTAKMNFVPFIY